MVIAKKLIFGKTVNKNTYGVPTIDVHDGVIRIPVSGYTKAEIDVMWNSFSDTLLIPNKLAEYGLIGAGASCYNPGYGSTVLTNLPAYSVYCDPVYNPNCVMPKLESFLGSIPHNDGNAAYTNSDGDGLFFCSGKNPIFRLNGSQVFNWAHASEYMLGLSSYDNNGITKWGTVAFFIISSDGLWGLFRLGNSKSNSYLRWANNTESEKLLAWLETLVPLPEDEDPYAGGEYSTPSDGAGEFNRPGEDVDIPALPSFDASDAGFVTLYTPTLTQLNNLANYLWSNDIASVIQKMFANPMDAVIGLAILPGPVPYVGARAVTVGNVNTGVSMNLVSSQFYTVDCGSITIANYSGSYLDYNPHTKIEIYLPYIGMRSLNADDVMGKTVNVVYHVDALSGACVAYIKVGGTVLYNFLGQCACSVPISGGDYTQVINGVLNIAGAIGTTIATGGASAPLAISSIASTALNGGLKTSCEKSGAISGTGGLLSIQRPYLIITTPRQCLPREQNKMIGYPSFITEALGDLTGYTEVNQIHLENISATGDELTEIENLLKGGVIL